MRLHRLRNYRQFTVHEPREAAALEDHLALAASLIPPDVESWSVKGYSYTADREVMFLADFQHSGGTRDVNWRERLCCPVTAFNNRQRAAIHIFDLEMEPYRDSSIFISEQITPMYDWFSKRYANVTGSEYLGNAIPYGTADSRGVRNETLCDLTFSNDSFEIIVSLDVFEHIPDYRLAFGECYRVLKTGGRMLWSVPFVKHAEKNIVRARVEDGEVKHLMSPEYHGDPLVASGVLCFTHFGWEMLDDVRAVGFKDAYAIFFYSSRFGYLGGEQVMFVARK